MNIGRWLISLSLLLFSISASADYYKYIDKDGNVHYTDDLTNVPESQRTDINEYTGIPGGPYDQQLDEQNSEIPQIGTGEEQVKNKQETDVFSEEKERLAREKEKLEAEYKDLMEEKKEITENKDKYRSGSRADKYNKDILEFNKKIEDYERRKEVFNEEVEKYNQRVEAFFSNELEKGGKRKESD